MTIELSLPGLQIESNLICIKSANFVPPTWPPSMDFPVILNAKGEVVSRFGDPIWKLGHWAGTSTQLNFGDGRTHGLRVDRRNANISRAVAGWWLWGPGAVRKARTLLRRHDTLKPLFVACTHEGIIASKLYKYPRVIERIATTFSPARSYEALSLLNRLWLARDDLGFTILDEAGLRLFGSLISERNSTQTAYIPPRIWSYQLSRLKYCLDDYVKHRAQIEACYGFCLQAFAMNAGGSMAAAFTHDFPSNRAPFNPENMGKDREHYVFHGPFRLTARKFGIEGLLDRWVNTSSHAGIKAFSSYLSLTNHVGLAYVLNFSLMRIDEGTSLRANCYTVESDSIGEDIHLISGPTTKTTEDESASWIVSPSTKQAIEVMTSVAALRLGAARHDPRLNLSEEDFTNPRLLTWAYEPWSPSSRGEFKKRKVNYSTMIKAWPKLFDKDQLRITAADLELAQRMTLGLDPEIFAVGKVWVLAWHQLRRTGAVNMLASGLVSDASLQYQLKHATRAMSRYYGQNYYQLNGRLDEKTRGMYLKEMYQLLVHEFRNLEKADYISPHGEKRKLQIIAPVSDSDHRALVRDAEAGRISYRENFLGGCAKLGEPCEFGGISNISSCMGFGSNQPCENLLIDRKKRSLVVAVKNIAIENQKVAPEHSALSESLQAQIDSAERTLNVIDKS